MTPASVLRIGSVTKQFTAAALLKLQEEGRLSVDARLSRFVPEVGPPAEQVTLRQMLNHVSGLGTDPCRQPAPTARHRDCGARHRLDGCHDRGAQPGSADPARHPLGI